MARLDPSIRHAISPPEFGEDKLHRAELVDRLHGEIPKKLIAVAAPAGYGKTTLLADFVAHTEIPVVWARASESDQDLMRFASLLTAALEKRFRRLRELFDFQTYAGADPQALAYGFINLIEEQVPENFILILDDVHKIHSSNEVVSFLDTLIINLPGQMTVIAGGREVLEVSLARLMAEDDLAGFGPHDLSLTWNETADLLKFVSGKDFPPIEVSQVHEYTRGWITGVILSKYSATQATLESGISESLIYEYLSSVIINRQPEELRRFMLEASVLPVMTAASCNKILERDDSASSLEELLSRNLFISVSGDEDRIYEFHPIFRNQLDETLAASSPERQRDLRERAADYFREESPEVSFTLQLELEDPLKASEIAEEYGDHLYKLGRYATIEKWYTQLQDVNVFQRAPMFAYYKALIFLNRGSHEEALSTFEQIIHYSDSIQARTYSLIEKGQLLLRFGNYSQLDGLLIGQSELMETIDEPRALAQWLRLDASIMSDRHGEHASAAEHLEKAIELLEGTEYTDLLLGVLQDQTYYFGVSGDVARARNSASKSLDVAKSYSSPMSQIASLLNIGQIEYLDGNFQDALVSLENARNLASKTSSSEREAEALGSQADIFNDVGLLIQAGELYKKGIDVAAEMGLDSLLSRLSIGVSSLQRRSGNYKLANDWLKRATEFETSKEPLSHLNQKAAIILESNPNQAVRILSAQDSDEYEKAAASDRTIREYFLARAFHQVGMQEEAAEKFEQCLYLCSILGTYQYVAAELFADRKFHQEVTQIRKDDVLFDGVRRQVSLIESFNSHYSPELPIPEEKGLIVTALGQVEVIWDGNLIKDLKPQAMELLFMLVDIGSIDRDRLIEEFWPDHPPGRQTGNLHMAVYSVRRVLGKERVSLRGTTYELDPEVTLRYDVAEFERAIEVFQSLPPGDPRSFFALTEANNRYGGSFLPEFYSDWVDERRRQLELKFLDIASEFADVTIRRDQPSKALSSLRNALNIDPYRDDLNEKYLEALLVLGRRSDVIAHYQAYRKMLEEDLGLQPAPRVANLYDKAMGLA